jgi:gluconate 5-dehydrogenase
MTAPSHSLDLSGRVALVTGANRGIGYAIAEGLGRAGARVVVNGRGAERTEAAATTLRHAGIDAHPSVFDVTDPEAVATAIDRIEREVGPLAILVNNAGMQHRAPFEDFPVETMRRVIDTNLMSALYVSQAAIRRMIPRGRGSIVNIGSVQSELGRATIVPYTVSKGGIKMLTRGLAAEFGPKGIRVNAVAPGYFATELNAALVADAAFSDWVGRRTPLGRWGEVDELAGAAVFLASDAASFVTGQILYVDGGMTSAV